MAGVMAQCGGLECMLNRLSGIKDFKQGRHLLTVSKNVFGFYRLFNLYFTFQILDFGYNKCQCVNIFTFDSQVSESLTLLSMF